MGSLMAGWDSPVPHPNLEKYRRTKSLTKEEIEAFWKSKKLKEEEHLRDISLLSLAPRKEYLRKLLVYEETKRELLLLTLPTTETERSKSLEKLIQKNGWWISSNWAFLNEPPVIATEGTRHKYASQFHVGNMPVLAGPASALELEADASGL
ncbi:UNVERIFIED_CONTAM: hypothetical protein Slati_2575400 [Sesamum latifolium]|uniref:Uncharacterized protein n=1 Tax=Sesamum latifolium TaxID=2727402 RepID=A0AAW2VTJ7_9LAMI